MYILIENVGTEVCPYIALWCVGVGVGVCVCHMYACAYMYACTHSEYVLVCTCTSMFACMHMQVW